MGYYDYVVKFNPKLETSEDLTKKILYALFVKRVKNKKPVVTFVGGDSGEGKSMTVLRFIEILFEIQGISLKEHLDAVNVFTPLQYPQKIDRLLHEPSLKKVNAIAIHEAREIIKASNWRNFLNTAIGDVNAMSRSIKRLMFFIISQFIRDIDPSIRYTLTYYCTVYRPIGHKARVKINRIWKDDSDLQNPRIRKRRIKGLVIFPNGKAKKHFPEYFEMNMPDKEICTKFDEYDTASKSGIIKKKLEKLIKEMEKDADINVNKIDKAVEYYTENEDRLNTVGKKVGKKWKTDKSIKEMMDLTESEFKDFESKLNSAIKEKWGKEENVEL